MGGAAVDGAGRVSTGRWKMIGVEEEHEIAASGAQPLVDSPPLVGRTRRQRPAGQHGRAVLLAYPGGAVGGLVVHERRARAASSPEPAHKSQRRSERAGANDHHSASARGA